jgi:hypothetical protein
VADAAKLAVYILTSPGLEDTAQGRQPGLAIVQTGSYKQGGLCMPPGADAVKTVRPSGRDTATVCDQMHHASQVE